MWSAPTAAAAEQAGGLTDAIAAQTREVLLTLKDNARAVLLNCSTLGPSVNDALAAQARRSRFAGRCRVG